MNKQDIEKGLIEYFNQYSNKSITLETRVNKDIGLAISEYTEIVLFIKKKFNVDFKLDNPNDYFKPESPNLMELLKIIFGKETKVKYLDLKIADLLNLIVEKRLEVSNPPQ